MPSTRLYHVNQSPLFRLSSRKRLALLLGISVRNLELLVQFQPENFRRWSLGQTERDRLIGLPKKLKKRDIQQPKFALHAIHRKLALLLSRIEKPDFVYSATKGRSYVDNALQHKNDFPCVKVDIKEFYPSVKLAHVRRFYKEEMECADDVAHLLAVLCCSGRSLATGSAVSPALSFFACKGMFDDIAQLARERDLIFTLYVDDMVFSGAGATLAFAEEVRRLLARQGFVGHKIVRYRANAVKVVTGVAVANNFVDLPNSRQRKIRMAVDAFARVKARDELKILGTSLIGQYREAEHVRPGMKFMANAVKARLDSLGIAPTKPKVRGRLHLDPSSKIFDEMRLRRIKLRQIASAQREAAFRVTGTGLTTTAA